MRLGYVLLYVPDVTAALAFYGAAFGLRVGFRSDDATFAELETGETVLGFVAETFAERNVMAFRRQRPEEAPAAVEIAFTTGDVAAAVARAEEAGAVVVQPPAEKPWGQTVAYVRDLNGVLVELCTPVPG